MKKSVSFFIFSTFLVVGILCLLPGETKAQSVEELQKKINERNEKIQALEKEINSYQTQVKAVNAQANTLQTAIKSLDVTGKQLSSEIKLAENNIGKTELTIKELGLQIGELEEDVETNSNAIAETIRDMNEADHVSLFEMIIQSDTASSVWQLIDTLESFQTRIKDRILKLEQIQVFLDGRKTETEKKKRELLGYKGTLSDKKQLVDVNKKEKSTLLVETKNKETEYNKILAQKTAERAAFERELFQLESQLNIAIDKSKIAPAGKGVLKWPLDNIYITQSFGRTVDAARLYVSGTHNGIDLRAVVNTPVKAALTGVVTATGNTDAQAGCYSYGKWVLIKHNNGLSTLYAHLNLIKVGSGQTVGTGEIIGYSGQTGYATGPHLHFTVYATEGVRVQQYSMSMNCRQVSIPISDPKAYLDPMLYL